MPERTCRSSSNSVGRLPNGLLRGVRKERKVMEQQARDSSKLLERITIDPDVCHGKPCIRGLRYPVDMILELLSGG